MINTTVLIENFIRDMFWNVLIRHQAIYSKFVVMTIKWYVMTLSWFAPATAKCISN